MEKRTETRFEPYTLTPEWFNCVCLKNPNSASFTTELISKKNETCIEDVQIGYSDPVEYMMCNDGEYPPADALCHGETEPVEVDVTKFCMHERVANLVKDFCQQSDEFEKFCRFLVLNDVNIVTEFANVSEFFTTHEISAKHIPKKMFVFPSNVTVNRPRFWVSSRWIIHGTPGGRMIVVQPDRNKQKYLGYTFKSVIHKPNTSRFFITKSKKHTRYYLETHLISHIIIAASSKLYLLKI